MKELLQTRRVFVAILALGLFIMAARSVTDPDVWWHLRTGQLIIQNHRVFHTDPYSFTKFGQPWIDHEWLSQILIFGLYRLGGWGALMAGFAAVIAATYWLAFLRCPGRPYVAGAITVWGALASIPSWGVRPQMLTLLLASLFLLMLERSYQRPNLLWWLPPLMLLWVNLHAGYAVGIGFLVLFIAGHALDIAFGVEETSASPRLRSLALASVACVAVVLLNPYGAQLYRYPLETLHSRAMLAYIGEWLSPDFHQPGYLPVLLMMLATLVLPAISPRCLRPRQLLLLAVTMYAGLRSARHLPIYVLVAVPVLSAVIQSRLQASGMAGVFDIRHASLTRTKLLFNATVLVALLILTGARLRHQILQQGHIEAREFPQSAASFLTTNRPPGLLLNHYNWGGYFIWKLYPEYKVYIDGRADVYGDSFMDDFAAMYFLRGKSWQSPLEQWDIRTLVLPPDAPLVNAFRSRPGWKEVFADKQAVVLTKTQ